MNVENGKEADFLNDYFVNILKNLEIPQTDDLCLDVYKKEIVSVLLMTYLLFEKLKNLFEILILVKQAALII